MFDFEQWLLKNGFTQAHYDNGARVTFEKVFNANLCVVGIADDGFLGVVVLSTTDADRDPSLLSNFKLPTTELQAVALLEVIGSYLVV